MLDCYRGREGAEFLERQTIVLIGSALALLAVFGDGRLDLAAGRWFFDDTLRTFSLANHWLLKDVLHDAARIVSATAAALLCVTTAAAWVVPPRWRLRAYREELVFVSGALLAATISVGALKHFSAHACPWNLELFGGTATYHALLSTPPANPIPQGCFPAAHPLSGYAWLAVGFALWPQARRLAHRAWQLAFVLGTLFGAVQVARGAHFPSHVLWTAWVTWAVNVGLLTVYTLVPRLTKVARPMPLSNG